MTGQVMGCPLYWRAIDTGSNGTFVKYDGQARKWNLTWASMNILSFGKLNPGILFGSGSISFASTALSEADISLLSHRDIGFIMKRCLFVSWVSEAVWTTVSFFFCFQLKPCLFLLFWFFLCFHRVILLSSISYLLTQISQVFCFFLSLDYDFCHILQHKLSIGDAPRREAFFHCKHLGKDLMIRLKGQNSPSLYFIIYLLLPEWVEYLGKLQSLCRLGPFHSNSPISFYYLLLSYWPVVRHLILIIMSKPKSNRKRGKATSLYIFIILHLILGISNQSMNHQLTLFSGFYFPMFV